MRSAKAGGATPSRRCEWLPQAILRVASVSFAARPASVCGEVRLERSPRKKSSMLRTGEFFWLPSRSFRLGGISGHCVCVSSETCCHRLAMVGLSGTWFVRWTAVACWASLSHVLWRSLLFSLFFFFSGTPRDKDASIPL